MTAWSMEEDGERLKAKPKSWALVPWLLWAQRAAGPPAARPAPGQSRLILDLGGLFSAAAFEIWLPGHNPGSAHSQLSDSGQVILPPWASVSSS